MTRHRCDVAGRLAMLPRTGLSLCDAAHVYWDSHQIPFIEAESDHDLAVTLGLVHVHLRWTQMEIMRHVVQGRMAELLGPFGIRLDRALRTLDLARAAPAILSSLPGATRDWVSAFVAGINHAIRHLPHVPAEFRALGLSRQAWTVLDVIGIGRLAALDVNWFVWHGLLRRFPLPEASALWRRSAGLEQPFARPDEVGLGWREPFLRRFGRLGSNSWAVAPTRSLTGGAWIASDTHLEAVLPNLWLIAGYRSPSYHAVGLMAPGIPAILLGRNPWIAWGGTNLHAASSDLFDVSHLPSDGIAHRRERLGVRFAGRREITVRETALGPVVSDLVPKRRDTHYALRWIGHDASDELSAMLGVNRARDWETFVSALNGIAVPGQNMIFADVAGHIGKAMAVHLPARPFEGEDSLLLPIAAAKAWEKFVRCEDLPISLDPPEGFVASANERPTKTEVLIGHLFSSDHRINRLRDALERSDRWDFATLTALQRDVLMPAALPIRDLIAGQLRRQTSPAARQLAEALAAWDGRYEASSRGALAFELLLFRLGIALHGRHRMSGYAAIWNARELLFHDLRSVSLPALSRFVREASTPALRDLRRFRTWGAMHRVSPRHFMARLPVIGRSYRSIDLPADGGSDTLLKTAHAMTKHRHRAGLASTARHISDLSDPDANWFVLLGGQDGWSGSTTMTNQVPLWRDGDYVRVPLRLETVRANFPYCITLSP